MAFGEPAATARGEIIGVQYLRGIAAIAVVLDHASGTLSQGKYLGHSLFGGLLENGQAGVVLFFLISGFIIAAISLRGPELEPAIDHRSFFLRRFVRVVPVMWVAILSYALLRGFGHGWSDIEAYLRALFLIPYGPVKPQTIWTLRQELIFYALFAFTMLGPRKLRWLMLVWVLAPLVMAWPRDLFAPKSIPFEFLRIVFHPVSYGFGAGLLLAILWFRRTGTWVLRVPIDSFVALILAFGLPLGVSIASRMILGYPPSILVLALCCAPVLFLGIHLHCPPGIGQRIGRVLGDASYSIYLFHVHVISIASALWMKFAPSTPAPVIVLGMAVAAVAVSVGIHYMVERPVVRAARRIFDRRAEASGPPVSPAPAPAQPGH